MAALAAPGTAWLLAFFAVPFYAIAAVAFGYADPVFGSPVPEWDPRYWDFTAFSDVLRRSLTGDMQPVFLRTFLYVALALVVCFIVGYPIAYYLARLRRPPARSAARPHPGAMVDQLHHPHAGLAEPVAGRRLRQ